MKQLLLFLFSFFTFLPIGISQNGPVGKDSTPFGGLQMIVLDFADNFKNTQAALKETESEYKLFATTFTLHGARECFIRRYHAVSDGSASWEGIVYDGENGKEAVKAYNSFCRSVKSARINLQKKGVANFTGKVQEYKEEMGFAETIFQLNTKDELYKKLRASIEIVHPLPDSWKVIFSFYGLADDLEK